MSDPRPLYKTFNRAWAYIVQGVMYIGSNARVAAPDGKSLVADDYYDSAGNIVDKTSVESANLPDCAKRAVPVYVCNSAAIGGGGGGGSINTAGLATKVNQQSIITALNSTAESDESQVILNQLVTEANDSQTLLTALQTAINGATDEAVITSLTAVKTAVEDHTEDDQTQVKLDDTIAKIGSEGDQTQALLAQMIVLNTIDGLVPESSTITGGHVVPAGNVLVIIHNTSGGDMIINGVNYPNGAYFNREREGGLPTYTIVAPAQSIYELNVEHVIGKGGL